MLLVILKTIFMLPYLLYRQIKDKKEMGIHLYGIKGFFGLPGAGKTIVMSKELDELRKRYGDKIYIMTNYFYNKQDFEFTSWRDLLKDYDKPIVVAWDEIQNEFNSRDFKDFPIQLLTELTQVRKGKGMLVLYTSQRWHFVDKNFRSLSSACSECKTILGNLTYYRTYDPLDYDNLCSNSDYDKRRKIHPKMTVSFLQNEELRNSYDSYKKLESAKSKEYMDRTELAQVYKMGE